MPPSADPSQDNLKSPQDTPVNAAATETTPLLAPETASTTAQNGESHPNHVLEDTEDEKMPYTQILLLCYASLAEPVAYFSIFPFVNAMIESTGSIPESSVGFYSGLIESLFSLVQMVLMIFYGRMSDRLGRKPILVFSLAGVSISTALFGMSRTLWQMIMFRCLAGVFAGSVVTVRTMLSENTGKKTQGRAFAWYMFTRNLGIFLGPLVGGGLAEPADQFPGTFGNVQFFKDYPYALPTFVAGAICMTGTLSSLFFLKEVSFLLRSSLRNPLTPFQTLTRTAKDSATPSEPPLSTLQVLRSPGVPMVLYIFGHTMVLALAFTAVSPVFQYTSISLGGLSFSPRQISLFLALGGFSQALWMLLAFPFLQSRIGTGRLLRICAAAWPSFMALYPVLNELLRRDLWTPFWILAPIGIVGGSGVAMAFACVQLALNDVSPSKQVLGTVNALALTVNSGVRAVVPAGFTTIYALGIKWGWADGHLAWILLVVIAVALNWAAWNLPEQAEGKPEAKKGRDDD